MNRQDQRCAFCALPPSKTAGETSAAGQNTRYNSITIDGATTNDTFGLEANNLQAFKQPISIDAIQSVQVNLSNYDVTQKGYTGANINAVTKSGTNKLAGSLYYVWRDDNLVGDRYNRTNDSYFPAPSFEEDTKGFTLSCLTIQDQLFFFASHEEFKSSRTSPDFGPLGSSRTNAGITQSAIDQAISIARITWNMDAGSSTVPDGLAVGVKDTLLKLDWNISDQHRANLRCTKTEQDEPNMVGFSGTGLSLSSWRYNQAKSIESVVGQWFADWTPDLSTELKLSKRNHDSQPTPVNSARLPAIGLRFSGAVEGSPAGVNANNRFLNMGTELSRHFNVLSTETTDLYAGGTWNVGAHELKFGLDYAANDVYNAFLQNVNGNYTFGCELGTYSFGRVGTGAGAVAADCNALTAAQRDLAVLENFRAGKPSAYIVQAPRTGRTLDDATATGTDGRPLFYTPQTYAQACWSGSTFSTTGACAGSRVRALSNPQLRQRAAGQGNQAGRGRRYHPGHQQAQPGRPGLGPGMHQDHREGSQPADLVDLQLQLERQEQLRLQRRGPAELQLPDQGPHQRQPVVVEGLRRQLPQLSGRVLRGPPRQALQLDLHQRPERRRHRRQRPDVHPVGSGVGRGYLQGLGHGDLGPGGSALLGCRQRQPGPVRSQGRRGRSQPQLRPLGEQLRRAPEPGAAGLRQGPQGVLHAGHPEFRQPAQQEVGRINEIGFPSNRCFVNFNGLDANGKYIYSMGSTEDLVTRQASGESQWALQATLRYAF